MNTRENSFLGMRGKGRGGESVVGMRPCGDGPWGGDINSVSVNAWFPLIMECI